MNTKPLVAGNLNIATQRISGDCGELMIGDSTSAASTINTFGWAIGTCFRPNHFGGWGAPGALHANGSTLMTYYAVQAWATYGYPSSASDPDSLTGFQGRAANGGATINGYTTYNGGTAAADNGVASTRILDYDLAVAAMYPATDYDGYAATVKYCNLNYASAPADFMMRVCASGRGNANLAESLGIAAYAASPTYVTTSLSLAAQTWSTDLPILHICSTPGVVAVDTKKMIHIGCSVKYRDGFRPMCIGIGGSKAAEWATTAFLSDAYFSAVISMHDATVVRICLGTNDTGASNKAAYKADVKALMDRLRALRPGIRFILVTPHQLSTSGWVSGTTMQDYVDALYELTIASPGDTLFLNVHKALFGNAASLADTFTLVNARLLSDGTHPHQTGYAAKAWVEWGLTEMAAAASASVTLSTGVFRKPY